MMSRYKKGCSPSVVDLSVVYTGCDIITCTGTTIKNGMTLKEIIILLAQDCYEPESVSWGDIIGDIEEQTDLVDFIQSQLPEVSWGNISGDINDQTDLTALIESFVPGWGDLTGDIESQEDLINYLSDNFYTQEVIDTKINDVASKSTAEYYRLAEGVTTLPTSPEQDGVELTNAWTWLSPGVTYTVNGTPITTPDDRNTRADWDGTSWSLVDMGELPKADVKEWASGTYPVGEQRVFEGVLYIATSPILEVDLNPTLSTKWVPYIFYNEKYALSANISSNINFDLVNNKVVISDFYAVVGGRRFIVRTGEFDFDTGEQLKIIFSKSTGDVSIVPLSTSLTDDQATIATFSVIGDNLYVNGLTYYYINGDLPPTGEEVVEKIALLNVSPEHINFDLSNRLIEFTGGAIILDDITNNPGRITISEQNVVMPVGSNSFVVLYDKVNDIIVTRNQASPSIPNHLILFAYRYTNDVSSFTVNGLDNYLVNGENPKDQTETSIEKIARLSVQKDSINFDLSNRLLKFSGTGSIILDDNTSVGRIVLPQAELEMSTSIVQGVVLYNRDTGDLVIRSNTSPSMPNHLILFTYRYTGAVSTFTVEGLENYLINGSEPTLPGAPIEKIALLNIQPQNINFNLPDRLIEFSGGAIILDDSASAAGRILITPQSVNMPTGSNNFVVLYDKVNDTIVARNQSSPSLPNHLILFSYYLHANSGTLVVNGIDNYLVNGVLKSEDIRIQNKYAVSNFAIEYLTVPQQDGVGLSDDFNIYDADSDLMYGLYDDLMAETDFMTKTELGETATGIKVYKYNFNVPNPRGGTRVKPKIFISGGTHAGERLAVWTTYLFLKNLVTNELDSEMVEMLRLNFEWVIVPLSNPFALDVGSVNGASSVRWNSNGVDINRNYSYAWNSFPDEGMGSQVYKGTAPFSEIESQIMRDAFEAEKENLILVIDTHNYGSSVLTEDHADVWYSTQSLNMRNICGALADLVQLKFKQQYSYIPKDSIAAYATYGISLPTVGTYVNQELNIHALTIETSQGNPYIPEGYNFDSDVVTRSLEAYINSIYSISKEVVEYVNLER